MAAIETEELTKRYGDVVALDSLTLEVESGEVFGFLGPNGAGKTTTIDLLLDYTRPDSGSATILEYDARREADKVRDNIGVLPDGFDLWERSTGYRHLEFALDSKGGDATPDELLSRVGLNEEAAERRVGDYSRGMKQRLALAMALAGDPDVLILDEPSSGLDPHGIRTMQNIVQEEAESGTTIFFSSHILGQVAAVCDRVAILDEGELVTVDTIDGLRREANVGSELILEVEETADVDVAGIEAIDGVGEVTVTERRVSATYTDARAKADVISHVVERGTTVLDFETREPTLEDLFTAYTGADAAPDTETQAVEQTDEEAPVRASPDGGTPEVADERGDDR